MFDEIARQWQVKKTNDLYKLIGKTVSSRTSICESHQEKSSNIGKDHELPNKFVDNGKKMETWKMKMSNRKVGFKDFWVWCMSKSNTIRQGMVTPTG